MPTNILGESVCPYCGVGCQLRFEDTGNGVPRVRGVESSEANLGKLCAKGAQLGPTIQTVDRLGYPLVRSSRNVSFQQTDWSTALDHIGDVVTQVLKTYGPEAISLYGSGQLDTESCYIITKLFKGYLGCNNTDSNSRLCMAAAVAGYRSSLGSDAPPCCYDDVERADLVLIIGSNMAEAHPVTFDRLCDAKKQRPDMKIVVIDPRKTATAKAADLHLAISPGTDIALLNAIGRELLDMAHLDEEFVSAHTRGWEVYREFLVGQDVSELHAETKLRRQDIQTLAEWIGLSKNFLSFYCMGMNQSTVGMWKNNALINLHLMTGQIGKPGAGPFSLTGQPNAMGGREAGLLSYQLPGYRTVQDDAERYEVEDFWNLPKGSISSNVGLTAIEMFRALEKGRLKVIWIAGTNPAVSMPDLHQARRAFSRAELVVVQDPYHPTETTLFADVVLPVAQWGEKEWTSTNSERMVTHSPQLWDSPGDAWPDWQVFTEFAKTLGYPGFEYGNAGEIWDEYIQLTKDRPCDMAGITSQRLREEGSLQWPCPSVDHPGTKRRYLDRQFATPDGKAVFHCRDHRRPRESTDHEFPFILTTGRLYTHWHTLTRTAKAKKLVRREPNGFVEVHPIDAGQLDLQTGDIVEVSSRRGTIQLPTKVCENVSPGMVFIPFHWGDLFSEGNAANYLTISAIGRVAKQPELKYCAVHLEKLPAPPKVIEQSNHSDSNKIDGNGQRVVTALRVLNSVASESVRE